jgi:iron-sulfur cluster assembly protein
MKNDTDMISDTDTAGSAATIVILTEEAAVEVRKFFGTEGLDANSAALRVSVLPGGCSGFEYGLEVDEDPAAEDDLVVESQGVRMLMDPFSAQYLAGIVIGYHSSFKGSGFTFENPNATGSCGCGTSFSV